MIITPEDAAEIRALFNGTPVSLAAAATTTPTAKPKTFIASGGKQKDFFGEKKRTREEMLKFKAIYEQGGLVSTALDLYPLFVLANGYRLEGDKSGEYRQWLDSINFDSIVWQGVSDAINYGDGFQENVGTRGNGEDVVNIVPRSPIDFEINYDERGIIKNYTQIKDENTGEGIKLKPEQITHIVLLPQSDSLYGMSMIKRAYDDIIRDTRTAEASAEAITRHGFKKYHIKIGQEGEIIDQTVIDKVSKAFETIAVKNEYTTSADVDIKELDEGGLEKIEDYNNISLMRVAASLGIPEELIGIRRGSTDNTAVARQASFFKKIQTYQHIVAQCYNVNVLDRKTGTPGQVKLIFSDCDPSDEVAVAGWISQMIKATPNEPFSILSKEWIQRKFNIETGELDTGKDTDKDEVKAQ